MVSYSNTGYENDFFDVSDVYFNSTSQSSGSAVDLDELDARYLQKTGGTVSSNLIVSGSVDIKTALTLPIIGRVIELKFHVPSSYILLNSLSKVLNIVGGLPFNVLV